MDSCEVLIVGGGPAGSSCAWALGRAGLDVIVADRSPFPRDKVCAGWITPQVVDALQLDCDEYRRRRTFQPITGFLTGIVGEARELETTYGRPVSFGIRRCEFDHYLLQRSGVRLRLGTAVSQIRRAGAQWVVNDCIKASVVVGAGGHFCPIAAPMNPSVEHAAPLVVAQEAEFEIDPRDRASWTIGHETPELYFCRDLKGYGWCFRKGAYMNIGFGRRGRRSLPKASADFAEFLRARGKIPRQASWRWRGHAYLVSDPPRRRIIGDGVMLAGDAAGLAYSQSGEGIRPAIESGLIAASVIVSANGIYSRDRLEGYEEQLRARFGLENQQRRLATLIRSWAAVRALPWLLDSPLFTRHVVLDRWFLHASEAFLRIAD